MNEERVPSGLLRLECPRSGLRQRVQSFPMKAAVLGIFAPARYEPEGIECRCRHAGTNAGPGRFNPGALCAVSGSLPGLARGRGLRQHTIAIPKNLWPDDTPISNASSATDARGSCTTRGFTEILLKNATRSCCTEGSTDICSSGAVCSAN